MKKLVTVLLVLFLTSCGDSSLMTIDNKDLKSFEDLEKRKIITIDRNLYNAFTKIEWDSLTRAEVKLLFSNKSLRDSFVNASKSKGVDVNSYAVKSSATGRFRKLLEGYHDALEELKKSSKE